MCFLFQYWFANNAFLWGKCALASTKVHQSTENNVLHGHSFSVSRNVCSVLSERAVSVKNYLNDILGGDC